ncbi:hypothetical protein D3C76_912270 [compost metagenome]
MARYLESEMATVGGLIGLNLLLPARSTDSHGLSWPLAGQERFSSVYGALHMGGRGFRSILHECSAGDGQNPMDSR